jgi:hypothetical protein
LHRGYSEIRDIVRQAAQGKSDAGPIGRESVDSQLHRQPTPASIAHAKHEPDAMFEAALARAKKLDSESGLADCMSVLAEAKRLFKF